MPLVPAPFLQISNRRSIGDFLADSTGNLSPRVIRVSDNNNKIQMSRTGVTLSDLVLSQAGCGIFQRPRGRFSITDEGQSATRLL